MGTVVPFPHQRGYDPSLDKKRAAEYLGIGRRTLERLTAEGKIVPHRVRENGKLLFRLSDLDRLDKESA